MPDILFDGNVSEEKLKQLRHFLATENIHLMVFNDSKEKENHLNTCIQQIEKENIEKMVAEQVGNFLLEYAIEFKKTMFNYPLTLKLKQKWNTDVIVLLGLFCMMKIKQK